MNDGIQYSLWDTDALSTHFIASMSFSYTKNTMPPDIYEFNGQLGYTGNAEENSSQTTSPTSALPLARS